MENNGKSRVVLICGLDVNLAPNPLPIIDKRRNGFYI
jgi:hypothetical protein